MFEFLKKILKPTKDEPKEELQINLLELEEWLSKETGIGDDPQAESAQCLEAINAAIPKLEKDSIQLKNTMIPDPTHPPKVREQIEAARASYLKRTAQLHTLLSNATVQSIPENCGYYLKEIENYKKSIVICETETKESFQEELETMRKTTEDLSNQFKHLQSLNVKENVNLLKEIKRKIKLFLLKQHTLNELTKEQTHLKEAYEELAKKKEYYDQKIEKLRTGERFKRLNGVLSEKEEKEKELKEKQEEFKTHLTRIEKPLTQYAQENNEERLITSYLQNPTQALMDDAGLRIRDVFANLKVQIKNDKFELQNEKKAQCIEVLEAVSGDHLKTRKAAISAARERIEYIERTIKGDIAMQEYKELTFKRDHYSEKLKQLEEQIAKIAALKEKQGTTDMLTQIQSDVYTLTKKEISIIQEQQLKTQESEIRNAA